jgi:hypothetical protein
VEAASNADGAARDSFVLRKPEGWAARWPEERRRRRLWLREQGGAWGQEQQQEREREQEQEQEWAEQ